MIVEDTCTGAAEVRALAVVVAVTGDTDVTVQGQLVMVMICCRRMLVNSFSYIFFQERGRQRATYAGGGSGVADAVIRDGGWVWADSGERVHNRGDAS